MVAAIVCRPSNGGVYDEIIIINSSIIPVMVRTTLTEMGINSSAPNTRRYAECVCVCIC